MHSLRFHIYRYDQHSLNISSWIMKFTIYKELHSKCGTSSVCLCSDGDCDATQRARTQCPQQSNKKSFCLKETWDTKTHFLSCLRFISVSTNFRHVVPRVGEFFTVILTHSGSFSRKNFNSCIGLPTCALSKRLRFYSQIILLCVSFSPMCRDCQSLIWKKSKQTKKKPKNNQTNQHKLIFAFWSPSFLHTKQPWVFWWFFGLGVFIPSIH